MMLRLLREYVRPHAGRLLWAALFMAIVAATAGLNAWLLEPAIDKVCVEREPGMLVLVPLVLVAVAFLRGGARRDSRRRWSWLRLEVSDIILG